MSTFSYKRRYVCLFFPRLPLHLVLGPQNLYVIVAVAAGVLVLNALLSLIVVVVLVVHAAATTTVVVVVAAVAASTTVTIEVVMCGIRRNCC